MSNSRSFTPNLICDVVTSSTPGLVALASLGTQVLPDGCGIYVVSNKTFYRLDKLSTNAAVGGLVAAAGGGMWLPESTVGGGSLSSVAVRNTLDKTVTLTGVGNFLSLNDAGSSYASVFTGGSWAISTTSGIATYSGPSDGIFLVTATATMFSTLTVGDTLMGVAVGGAVDVSSQVEVSAPVATGNSSFFSMSVSTILQLSQGEIIDIQFAGEAATLTVTKLVYTLTPA